MFNSFASMYQKNETKNNHGRMFVNKYIVLKTIILNKCLPTFSSLFLHDVYRWP